MATHRINGDELDPMTECGLAPTVPLAYFDETPTCRACATFTFTVGSCGCDCGDYGYTCPEHLLNPLA